MKEELCEDRIGSVHHDDISCARGDLDDNDHNNEQTMLIIDDDGHDNVDHDKMVSTMIHTSLPNSAQHPQYDESAPRCYEKHLYKHLFGMLV